MSVADKVRQQASSRTWYLGTEYITYILMLHTSRGLCQEWDLGSEDALQPTSILCTRTPV